MKSMQRDKTLQKVIGGFIEWGVNAMHLFIPTSSDEPKVIAHAMERHTRCILRDISTLTACTDQLRRTNMVDPSYVPFLLPLYVEFDTMLFKFIMGDLENRDEIKDHIYGRLYDFGERTVGSERARVVIRYIDSMLSKEHREEFYSRVSSVVRERYDDLIILSKDKPADIVTEKTILARVLYEIITRDENDDIFKTADDVPTLVIYKDIVDACKALVKQEYEPAPSRWIVRMAELSKFMNKPDYPDVRKVLVSRLTK